MITLTGATISVLVGLCLAVAAICRRQHKHIDALECALEMRAALMHEVTMTGGVHSVVSGDTVRFFDAPNLQLNILSGAASIKAVKL